MASTGRFAVEKRRQAEDACRSMEARITEDRRSLQIASFESSSTIKIDRKLRDNRANQLRGEDEKLLRIRRQSLADLYNDEMDHWRSEVRGNEESQEDRKARSVKGVPLSTKFMLKCAHNNHILIMQT
jgi:hypothetical protein